jgi:hypothetical protein
VQWIDGNRFTLGELDGSRSERITQLSAAMMAAGFKAPVARDVRAELWVKLWGNSSFNPISALTGQTLEALCRYAPTRDLAARIMREGQAVGEALGVPFKISIEQRIAGAEAVGAHKTSMLQDIEFRRGDRARPRCRRGDADASGGRGAGAGQGGGGARLMATPRRSPLYDRANGFCLGVFLALARNAFAQPLYRVHRARIMEFAAEAGLPISVPSRRAVYNQVADQVLHEAVLWCKDDAPAMADFILAGTLAVIDASLRLSDEPLDAAMRGTVIGLLDAHGLAGERLYDRFLAEVRKESEEGVAQGLQALRVQAVLTPAMGLLAAALEPLPVEAALWFVAMPYRQPFAGYFGSFYRPLAEAMGGRALRGWGSLSGEAYVELMLTIMRRCHGVIADLSGLNANVLYEVGVARGLAKPLVPLCRRRDVEALPSNIASDQWLLVYSPREKSWPEQAVLRAAAQVSVLTLGRTLADQELAAARWAPGERLPTLAGPLKRRSRKPRPTRADATSSPHPAKASTS